jgi:WD40 repeat protein
VEALEASVAVNKTDWIPKQLLALVHLERGDRDAAAEIIQAAPADEQESLQPLMEKANRVCVSGLHVRQNTKLSIITPNARWIIESHSVWDAQSGEQAGVLEHDGAIGAMACLPDAQHLLGLTFEGVIPNRVDELRLWDLPTGKCLQTFEGAGVDLNSLAVTADGRYALGGYFGEKHYLWDLQAGTYCGLVGEHMTLPYGIAINLFDENSIVVEIMVAIPHAQQIVSGDTEGVLRLFELPAGRLRKWKAHPGEVSALAVSHDGRHLISGGKDGSIHAWLLGSTQSGFALLLVIGTR